LLIIVWVSGNGASKFWQEPLALSALPVFLWFLIAHPTFFSRIEISPTKILFRNFLSRRQASPDKITELGFQSAPRGYYLVIDHIDAGRQKTIRFWNYYDQEEVVQLVDEALTLNPKIRLNENLAEFMQRAGGARQKNEPLSRVPFWKPVSLDSSIKKYLWLGFAILLLPFLLVIFLQHSSG
jgi:hypothetical protein